MTNIFWPSFLFFSILHNKVCRLHKAAKLRSLPCIFKTRESFSHCLQSINLNDLSQLSSVSLTSATCHEENKNNIFCKKQTGGEDTGNKMNPNQQFFLPSTQPSAFFEGWLRVSSRLIVVCKEVAGFSSSYKTIFQNVANRLSFLCRLAELLLDIWFYIAEKRSGVQVR